MNDLRYALRSLGKHPGFTLVAVLTLALGIGANTAVFSVVNGVLLRPLPYRDSKDLVMVFRTVPRFGFDRSTASFPDFADWAEQGTSFTGLAAYGSSRVTVVNERSAEEIAGARVTSTLWPVLSVQPAIGRAFEDHQDQPASEPVVVLSHGFWLRWFGGDSSVVGRMVALGDTPYRVTGVMGSDFYFPAPETQFWTSLRGDRLRMERDANFLVPIGRLAPGVSVAQAQAEMTRIANRIDATAPGANQGYGVFVENRLGFVVRDVRTTLGVLLGAVTLLLAIACANTANLTFSRAVRRRRELALRSALGSGRRRLVRALLTESLVLSVAGGAAGLLVAPFVLDALVRLTPDLPRAQEIGLRGSVLLYTALMSLVAGVASGLVPALRAGRRPLYGDLREAGGGGSSREMRAQGTLVAVQVALATVLLIGAGLLINSFGRLVAVSPGFSGEQVLTARVTLRGPRYAQPAARLLFFTELRDHLLVRSGVVDAALTAGMPFSLSSYSRTLALEGSAAAPGSEPHASYSAVHGEYFRVMGIPLLRGRSFTDGDREGGNPVVMVNQSMADRFWPGAEAVGQRFKPGGLEDDDPWVTVIGVVGDVRSRDLARDAEPTFYSPLTQTPWPASMYAVVRADGAPAELGPVVRAAVREMDPGLAVTEVATASRLVAESVAGPRARTVLLGALALVAATLAVIGVYGVTAFGVANRSREFGVRMALGADARRVLTGVLGGGLRQAAWGALAGAAAALAATRVLRGMLYDVSPTDPLTFATVLTLLLGAVLAGCLIPARRAACIDPMEALRHE